MATTSTFSAGGLASGLDTNSIIEKLVEIESRPLDMLRSRQSALKTQVSLIGDVSSKLAELQKAAAALGSDGVLAAKASTSQVGYSAVSASGAAPGRYSLLVDALAQAAKLRSQGFTSSSSPVTGGTLSLTVMGTAYPPITVADGASLSDVAFAINQSDAPVTATVLSDGTRSYLSINAQDTGYPVGTDPAQAVVLNETSTGIAGQPLLATVAVPASNAVVFLDGLRLERRSNTFSDAVPGTTVTLKGRTTTAEDLVVTQDAEGTQTNLKKFVDAYNGVMTTLRRHLAVSESTDRTTTLAGDAAIRGLQQSMQSLLTTVVPGSSSVRSLADLGVKTAGDGTLSIDATALKRMVDRDPMAVNALFAQATTGMGAITDTMVKRYTNTTDGILTARTTGLNKSVAKLDDDAEMLQVRLDNFRSNLVRQFTAMETTVSGLKSIGNFLTRQDAASSSS